jgi:hypothetical protein
MGQVHEGIWTEVNRHLLPQLTAAVPPLLPSFPPTHPQFLPKEFLGAGHSKEEEAVPNTTLKLPGPRKQDLGDETRSASPPPRKIQLRLLSPNTLHMAATRGSS